MGGDGSFTFVALFSNGDRQGDAYPNFACVLHFEEEDEEAVTRAGLPPLFVALPYAGGFAAQPFLSFQLVVLLSSTQPEPRGSWVSCFSSGGVGGL